MSKKIAMLEQQIAEAAAERKEAELKEKTLKDALLKEFHKQGIEKQKTEYGSFHRKLYPRYTFSKAVQDLKAEVKEKEQDEIEQGIAEATFTETLAFTPVKQK